MKLLKDGARCSTISVFPKNWNQKGADVKLNWYVHYKYYPSDAKRKLVIIKGGVNFLKTLEEKRGAIKAILEETKTFLFSNYYNPTSGFSIVNNPLNLINPNDKLIDALWAALEIKKKDITIQTTREVESTLRMFCKILKLVNISNILVFETKRKHIKLVFENIPNISGYKYNRYRTYLMMLFNEIIECDAIEFNPCTLIKKKKIELKLREVTTKQERAIILEHLTKRHLPFSIFIQIFFHSGARPIELLRVQKKHIDIDNQRFQILIKKGKGSSWQWRTIKTIAMPLWENLYNQCTDKDMFLFSTNCQPGEFQVLPDKLTRRWSNLVKKELKIEKDMYSLKHSNLDEIAEQSSIETACAIAGHTSTNITKKYYLINQDARQHIAIKEQKNEF